MEIVTLKISKDLLQMLVDSNALSTSDFDVVTVDENGFDYTLNELWIAQKSKSTKAYKELKRIEFEIRNKI